MSEQITCLVQLQGVDDEVSVIQAATCQGTRKLEHLEKERQLVGEKLAAEKEEKAELEKTQREAEAEVEDIIELVKQSRNRLVDVKNDREYKALFKEIEKGESRIAETEEKLLNYMERLEEAGHRNRGLEQELRELEMHLVDEREAVETEAADGALRLKELYAAKERFAKEIGTELFGRYELIRERATMRVVVPVERGVCMGCNMNIPPQMYNELQRYDDLKLCPHCDRIIYWKKPE